MITKFKIFENKVDYPFILLKNFETRAGRDDLKNILLNKKISFTTYELNDRDAFIGTEINVVGVVKYLEFFSWSRIKVTLENGKKYILLYIDNDGNSKIYILDDEYAREVEERERELERKNEEIRKKMKDVDPYEEEEWDDN